MGLVEIVAIGFKFIGTILGSVLFIGSQGNWFSERFKNNWALHRLLGLIAITSVLIGVYLWFEMYYPIPKLEPMVGEWIGSTQSEAQITHRLLQKNPANVISNRTGVREPARSTKIEEEAWVTTLREDTENAYRTFVNRFPRSRHVRIARKRISAIQRIEQKPLDLPVQSKPHPPVTIAGESHRSQSYPFEVFVPVGWSWDGMPNETSGDLAVIRSPHFTYDHIVCNVTKEDASQLSSFSQDDLNAAIARGEVEGVLSKPFTLTGVTAHSDSSAIISLGDLVGQEVELTAIKDGYTTRLIRVIAITPGRAYYVNCIAPATMYDGVKPTFEKIVRSFRVVNA